MWLDKSILVRDQVIDLSIEYLDPDERERAAAEIAWFAYQVYADESESIDESTWKAFMEQVVFDHVTFSVPVPEQKIEELGRGWWTEATGLAMAAFVRTNGMAPTLRRLFRRMEGTDDGAH